MKTISLQTFALMAQTAANGYAASLRSEIDRAGGRLAVTARGYIGEYQGGRVGPFRRWPTLSPRTVERKEELGFAPPDNPLLRTGEMRSSIGHRSGADWTEIGSNSDVARWQEFGTDRIPPRSFLGRAMAEQGRDEAKRVVGRVIAPLFLAARAGSRRP